MTVEQPPNPPKVDNRPRPYTPPPVTLKEAAGVSVGIGAGLLLGLTHLAISFAPAAFAIYVIGWTDWHWLLKLIAFLVLAPFAMYMLFLAFAGLSALFSSSEK